ncbi:hypothetical protein [Pseudomonas sp. P97.38]|uniref:hypothetical protein n=1 Tax=Pseudomonas sp. P97.38 TaxID=255451 RepID=UPI00069F511D|nr:hypothetical protein [Pseudomonas sp. P97.38]
MHDLIKDWDETPLLRAGANVIDTATQRVNEIHCTIPGFPTRFNVGNIHEIKRIWNVLPQD